MEVNINDIDEWIKVEYGMVIMHGSDIEKERANIIMDYIAFLEKECNIKKCETCGKKFRPKRKDIACCSEECKKEKLKLNYMKYYRKNREKENKKHAEYNKKYRKENKEKIKEYQKEYMKTWRKKQKLKVGE